MMTGTDVAIVGGGVIGLSIAYALARRGVLATVIDSGELGRAASWAGAGIISPPSERMLNDPSVALRSLSARLHAEWFEQLLEETGIDNGYRLSGGVDVALTAEEDDALRASAGRWRAQGIAFERLEPGDFSRVEPELNPALRVAYYLPDRAQIRNPRHVKALIAACQTRGVTLRPGLGAGGFATSGDRINAVLTAEGPLPCGRVVVAAGSWSAPLLARLGIDAPTPPVKGQIVLLRADGPRPHRVVEHGHRYLVPRDDGRVLIGATEEDAGFDTRSTPLAVLDLITEALFLCPSLAEAEIERTWAGLRPGSFDGRPYLGQGPTFANLIVATGHRRTGLQLSTGTAEVIADLLLDQPPRLDLAPFRLGREPGAPADETFRS
ncbi:MAG: glycine oxidase ThiO [Isosphaeraceae bacterium]